MKSIGFCALKYCDQCIIPNCREQLMRYPGLQTVHAKLLYGICAQRVVLLYHKKLTMPCI